MLLLLAPLAHAGSPLIESLFPRAGQRGTAVDLAIRGKELSDALGITFYSKGIAVSGLTVQKDGSVIAHAAIAKDAPIGECALRLRTATGISNLITFWVGPYPIVPDTGKTGNRSIARAMPIEQNVAVLGQVQGNAVSYYRVQAHKGQRLSVEVVGMRLGTAMFDPCLQIVSSDGKTVLQSCDDTVFALADPMATMIVPYDGTVYLALRDRTYDAPPDSSYVMYVGSFPRPTVAFPLGGMPGEPMKVRFLGDAGGEFEQTVPAPAALAGADGGGSDEAMTMNVAAEQAGLTAPTPNCLRIDSCKNVISNDSNHSIASAMAASERFPLALNGILAKSGQQDFFRIEVRGKKPIDVRVFARQLRSPLDSVIAIYDAQGRELARNDDQPGTPDSSLQFVPRADGPIFIGIGDQLQRGGPDFAYRIEVTDAAPAVAVTLAVPPLGKPQPYVQTVAVARGNLFAAVVRIKRSGFDGPVKLTALDLPAGVTVQADPIPPGEITGVMLFRADAAAPPAGALCRVRADSLDPKMPVSGGFQYAVAFLEFDNNALHEVPTDRLMVAVTDPAPVSITADDPPTPLQQDGVANVMVHVRCPADFKGSLRFQLAHAPRGIHPTRLNLPPGVSDVVMPIRAEPNTPPGAYRIALRGTIVDRSGTTLIASNFITINVCQPAMSVQMPALAVAAGGSATVTCAVDRHQPLPGSAKLELLGLPPGCTALDQTLGPTDREARFVIHADAICRPGVFQGIFLRLTYVQAGQPMELNLDRGATIRVKSARSAPAAATPPPAPVAAAAPAREGK